MRRASSASSQGRLLAAGPSERCKAGIVRPPAEEVISLSSCGGSKSLKRNESSGSFFCLRVLELICALAEDLAEVRHPLAENSVAALQLFNAHPGSLAISVDDIVEAAHPPVEISVAGVGGRGSQGQPLPAGQRLEVVDQAVVAAVQEKQHGVPDDARGSTPVRPSTGSAKTKTSTRPALRSSKASMSSKFTGRSVGRPEKSTPASARAGCQPTGRRPRRVISG